MIVFGFYMTGVSYKGRFFIGDVDLGKFRFINVVILSFEKALRKRKFLFIDE